MRKPRWMRWRWRRREGRGRNEAPGLAPGERDKGGDKNGGRENGGWTKGAGWEMMGTAGGAERRSEQRSMKK